MERIKIDVYISDLLYSYDCVIVPDFGGFVANYAPAQIQTFQHKLKPPAKKITFNKNLKNNDGLLVNHIAERKSIHYEEAAKLIRSFVNQSIEGLKQGDKITIEKVGVFYMNPDRNIQFRPFAENDYLLDAFGLTSFRALPIKRQTVEEKVERKVKEKLPSKEKIRKKRPFYWSAAAVILILVVSTFILNNRYQWVESTKSAYALLSYSATEEAHYQPKNQLISEVSFEAVDVKPLQLQRGIYRFQSAAGDLMSFYVDNREGKGKTEIDNTKVVTSASGKSLKYHVMGGCFSYYKNAVSLVNDLQQKGFDSHLLGTYKNLHAVSYASFNNEKDARKLLTKVKNSENPAAWLLVKPF